MLPEYQTILYATDLSPNAARAFRHAVSLAAHYGAKIHLLHVLAETETAVVNYVATVMGEDKLADLELEHHNEVRAEILGRLETFTREELPPDLPHGCVSGIEVVHGDPAEEILETAGRIGADLIVMGSHSRGRLRQVLLGAVTERVLRRASCPVFVSRLVEP
ncbi:MAG: universal stress protein [Proteobacteria bacterium]|nr:universal stress protein [Pseudomonadota bacterium]